MATTSLVNVGEEIRELMEMARASVEEEITSNEEDQWTGIDNLKARTLWKALELSVLKTQTLRSVQMQLVAEIARNELWRSHPPTPDYEDGYNSLADMLKDLGFCRRERRADGSFTVKLSSTGSNLYAIGDKIVPFCDHHKLPIDRFMTNSLRPKLEWAIPALRAGIADMDVTQVKRVLKDVEQFGSREAIQLKYHKPRNPRPSQGTTCRLRGDDRVVVVLVLENDEYIQDILARTAGLVEWGLVAQADALPNMIEVRIAD